MQPNQAGPNAGKVGKNFNWYSTKKTMAQSLMDIALLTANASQLKMLLGLAGDDGKGVDYYYLLLTLISKNMSSEIISYNVGKYVPLHA